MTPIQAAGRKIAISRLALPTRLDAEVAVPGFRETPHRYSPFVQMAAGRETYARIDHGQHRGLRAADHKMDSGN